jgi:hypothetical protein
VTNTGNQPTGALTAVISGTHAGDFTVDGNEVNTDGTGGSKEIPSIEPGSTGTFPVGIEGGRRSTNGEVTAIITVSGGNGISESFDVKYTSVYSISLTADNGETDLTTEGYTFTDTTPLTVTVTNTGNNQTNVWEVVISGDDLTAFKATTSSTANLTAGKSATFTVEPLTAAMTESKTYTATITVRSTSTVGVAYEPTASFVVSYEYTAPSYAIALYDNATLLPVSPEKYWFLEDGETGELTVTVTNTGGTATGDLTVALSGADSGSFTLGDLTDGVVPSIAVSANGSFTVMVNESLEDKIYNATVTVSNAENGISKSFDITYWAMQEEDFHGTWQVGSDPNRRTLVVDDTSFHFKPTTSNDDVECTIVSWTKETWLIQNGTNIAAVGTTVTAWKIEAKVTTVNKITGGTIINAILGIASAGELAVDHEFTFWLLCKDPATITASSSSTGGINIGYINAGNLQSTSTWNNFLKQ